MGDGGIAVMDEEMVPLSNRLLSNLLLLLLLSVLLSLREEDDLGHAEVEVTLRTVDCNLFS